MSRKIRGAAAPRKKSRLQRDFPKGRGAKRPGRSCREHQEESCTLQGKHEPLGTRMDWLDDLLTMQRRAKIGRLEDNLHQARRSRRRRRRASRKLQQQVDELRLVALAMFELLMARAPVSNDELIAKIEEIDLRDGVADGRKRQTGNAPRCPECKRVLLESLQACLYCGPGDET